MSNRKIENAGVHHIAVAASDFDKSIRFYTEGLVGRQNDHILCLQGGEGRNPFGSQPTTTQKGKK